jgi:hypothetical protein
MSIVTTQQLARFYEQYRTTEVTFNKQVAAATGLMSRNVYLKIHDRQVSCVVFSSSMSGARVVATISAPVQAALKQVNNRIALRWCFKLPDKVEPITFFVPCHPASYAHYAVQDPDVQIVTLEYTQRPPDDLIQILGTLLEANVNAARRKDERIVLSPEVMKKMGLETREAALVVERATYKCALRDVSFSGTRILVAGSAAAFADRAVALKISRGDPSADIILQGIVRRAEEVGGRKDILTLGIEFRGDVPMTWKLLISSYLGTVRKTATTEKPAAAPPQGADQAGAEGAPAAGAAGTDAAPAAGAEVPDEQAPPADDDAAGNAGGNG